MLHTYLKVFKNYLHDTYQYDSISSYISDAVKVGAGAITGASLFIGIQKEVLHIMSSLIIAIGVSMITFFGPLIYRYYLNNYKGKSKIIQGLKEQLNKKN